MAIFNPRCWETKREQLGEAYMLIVVTVHEVGWQLAGWPLQAVDPPREASGAQEGLEGSSAFTGGVMVAGKSILSFFLWHFLATLFWLSTARASRRLSPG